MSNKSSSTRLENGKQYSGQKDRRRDRGPDSEQTLRNKHARGSWWDLHEIWRQLLNWTSLCLAFQRSKDCASFPCIPSEWTASHRECEAPFATINGWAWVGSCRCITCRWNLIWAPIRLPIPINTVHVGFGNQDIFLRPSLWCNPFVFFTEDKQEANRIFAQFGRSRADKVQWLSPILGKQLACDCGQSMCHAAVLDELIRELVTSGAMTNEGWLLHLRFARKHIQPGRNPQCRCFWNMLPENSVLSQSFKQAGWEVAWSLDTILNPDFNLQTLYFFAVAVGLLLEGRVAVLILTPLDAEMLVKLAQSQQRVNGYWIWIQSQSTGGSGRSSMSPSRRSSNCEVNMLGWSALESE